MKLPKQQVILARTRGNRTRYFYGASLKECLDHLKVGDLFCYRIYKAGPERVGEKTAPQRYVLVA